MGFRKISDSGVAEHKIFMVNKTDLVGHGVVPGDVGVVVFSADFDLVPLMEHRVGLNDLALYADLLQQIGIRLGIAVALSVAVYHQVVCFAGEQIAAVERKQIVKDKRLFIVRHTVVDLIEIPLRAVAEFRAHLHDLAFGVDFFLAGPCAVGIINQSAPGRNDTVDVGNSVGIYQFIVIATADIEQLGMSVHQHGKQHFGVISRNIEFSDIDIGLHVPHPAGKRVDRALVGLVKIVILRDIAEQLVALHLRRVYGHHNDRQKKHNRRQQNRYEFIRKASFHKKRHLRKSYMIIISYYLPALQLTKPPYFQSNSCVITQKHIFLIRLI